MDKLGNIYNMQVKNASLKKEYGLTEEIIKKISKEKKEPKWILDLRLKALKLYHKLDNPNWGPDISYLDINKIATYVKPNTKETKSWDNVPNDIKNVFDKLGIPDSEKEAMAGVGAQFDPALGSVGLITGCPQSQEWNLLAGFIVLPSELPIISITL